MTVNSSFVNGGGYADSSCTATVAPLDDIPIGVCRPVAQIPTFSVRVDLEGAIVPTVAPSTTAVITTSTPTVPATTT